MKEKKSKEEKEKDRVKNLERTNKRVHPDAMGFTLPGHGEHAVHPIGGDKESEAAYVAGWKYDYSILRWKKNPFTVRDIQFMDQRWEDSGDIVYRGKHEDLNAPMDDPNWYLWKDSYGTEGVLVRTQGPIRAPWDDRAVPEGWG